jgi:4-O-beta-D-mannosyl-D-glucose phosphorylase
MNTEKNLMIKNCFAKRLSQLSEGYEELIQRRNESLLPGNGIFLRYQHPVLTAAHTPLFWRYDLNERSNPYLMERFGINGVFNAGAIKWNGRYVLMARVEGLGQEIIFRHRRKSKWDRQLPFLGLAGPHAGFGWSRDEYL